MNKFQRKTSGRVWVIALNLILILSAAPSFAGEKLVGTVAIPDHLAVGDSVADFPVVTTEGKHSSFGKLRESVAIVAFVGDRETPAELMALAKRYRDRSATVAQIVSTSARSKTAQPGLSIFSDSEGIVSRAYRQPALGTVYLVNGFGQVVSVGKTGQLKKLLARADQLVEEVEAFEAEAYTGG